MNTKTMRGIFAALLTIAAGAAQAHPGHGTNSLLEGLVHPFGFDHLLAMVAVGVWSVSALPAHRAWQGPAIFLLALIVSAALGVQGVDVPFLEQGISLSVVMFGAMLLLAHLAIAPSMGLCLIAVAASLHGLAHGSEAPENGFFGYAAGFLITTAVLHIGGISIGLSIKHWLGERSRVVLGGIGGILSAAGLYLFGQLAA